MLSDIEQMCFVQDNGNVSVWQQEFRRHVMYWMHPSMPWLQMFPRHIVGVRQFGYHLCPFCRAVNRRYIGIDAVFISSR